MTLSDPDNSQGDRGREPGPVMYLSCKVLQDILSQWLEQNAIASGEGVGYQWIFDRHETPIGVNVWLEGDLELSR